MIEMTRERFNELVEEVESGERLACAADYGAITNLWWRLRLQEAERQALCRMLPQQRLRRYRAGELTAYQREVWANRYWHELLAARLVVNDLPVWFARTLCDIVDEGKG